MADPNRPKPRNVFITDEQHEWLKRRAKELGITLSALLRLAIDGERERTNA